jgi:crotonobetainyl-CoA:carnitine CoA-transferase CaiB-like acyl-CoA transferase
VLDPLITVLGPQPTVYGLLGETPVRTGNRSTNNAPRNTYLTADGKWVAVSSSATSIAERIMRIIGHPELIDEPWFASGTGRAEHSELIDSLVGAWISAHSEAEVLETFEKAQAAVAPVYDVGTLVADPHIRARQTLIEVPDADFGELLMQNVLARLSVSPGQIRFTGRPAGADTDEILISELGLPDSYVEDLRSRGIIQ